MGKKGGKGKETEAEVVVRFIDGSLGRARRRSGMKAKVWEGLEQIHP